MTNLNENDNIIIKKIQQRTMLIFTGLYLVFVAFSLWQWPRVLQEEASAPYPCQILLAWLVVLSYPFDALRKNSRFKNSIDIGPCVSGVNKPFLGRWYFPTVENHGYAARFIYKFFWGYCTIPAILVSSAIFSKPARDIFGQNVFVDIIASALPAVVMAYVLPGYMCRMYIDRPDFSIPPRSKPRNIFKFTAAVILFPVIAYAYLVAFGLLFLETGDDASLSDFWYIPLTVLSLTFIIPILVNRFAREESFDRSAFIRGYWTYMLSAMALALAFVLLFSS